jgi:dUTP pyrophosphatase
MIIAKFKKLHPNAVIPRYMTDGASGMDLAAAIEVHMSIPPGEQTGVITGLSIELPDGYEAQIRPRSGMVARYGVTVANAPGTIDSDYRGEIVVLLANHGQKSFTIAPGDRIAQLVIAPVERAMVVEEMGELSDSARGIGGFGSTGMGTKNCTVHDGTSISSEPTRTAIIIELDDYNGEKLYETLLRAHPQRIIDLRALPRFDFWRLNRPRFFDIIGQLAIDYIDAGIKSSRDPSYLEASIETLHRELARVPAKSVMIFVDVWSSPQSIADKLADVIKDSTWAFKVVSQAG